MKIINIILLISLASVFLCMSISCTTRKKSVEKQRTVTVYDTLFKRDSIFITKDKVILLPTVNTEVITNPCNESGKLKPIYENIKFPYGSLEIKSDGDNLIAKIKTDSINSVYQNQYRERNEKQFSHIFTLEKEIDKITKERKEWKNIAICFIMISVLLSFSLIGKHLYNKINSKI